MISLQINGNSLNQTIRRDLYLVRKWHNYAQLHKIRKTAFFIFSLDKVVI